jgi:hypothetical protein
VDVTLIYLITCHSFTVVFSILFSRVLLDPTISSFENFHQTFCTSCWYSLPATRLSNFTPIDVICLVIFSKYPVHSIKLQIVLPTFHGFCYYLANHKSAQNLSTGISDNVLTCFMTLNQLGTLVTAVSSCVFHLCVENTNIVGKTRYSLLSSYRVWMIVVPLLSGSKQSQSPSWAAEDGICQQDRSKRC